MKRKLYLIGEIVIIASLLYPVPLWFIVKGISMMTNDWPFYIDLKWQGWQYLITIMGIAVCLFVSWPIHKISHDTNGNMTIKRLLQYGLLLILPIIAVTFLAIFVNLFLWLLSN